MQQDALEMMEEGVQRLMSLLAPLGFSFRVLRKGDSSGGEFCQAEIARGNQRIELHFRHGLGFVRYHMGQLSASHGAYMAALDVEDASRFPGFYDDPLEGFQCLAHDLVLTREDFIEGDGTVLAKASAAEERAEAQQQRQNMIESVGDRQARSQAREAFRNREYPKVVRLLEGLVYPEDLSPAEEKLLCIARREIGGRRHRGVSDETG